MWQPAARPWGWRAAAYYYRPRGETALNLQLMRLLDEEYTRHHFKGVLGMRDTLRLLGHQVNKKPSASLVTPDGAGGSLSQAAPLGAGRQHHALPLPAARADDYRPQRGLEHGHHLRPMARGFLYLVAVLDWHSRYVLSWELSNTLDVGFCLTALRAALAGQPAPYSFNSDQGSQFTSTAFEQVLLAAGCLSSRDGRGRATDNAFVERLWRSVKWECVYLNPAEDGQHLYQQLQAYFTYYNHHRPHQALKGQTPASVYRVRPNAYLHPRANFDFLPRNWTKLK